MEKMTFRELGDAVQVLYEKGRYAEALQRVEQNLDTFPEESTRTTFWRMCLLSLTGRPAEALSVFQQGLDAGCWWSKELFIDPDLDAVRDLPEFQRLVARAEESYQQARIQIPHDQAVLLPAPPASKQYPLLIALHGRYGNQASHLQPWETARQRGWLVVSPQSTQPLFSGAYCWDDPNQALVDVFFSYEQISQQYQIDPQRVILAGFSQGSGAALSMALSGKLPARGFIGVASWWGDPKSLVPQSQFAKRLRGYFVTGEKDHTLETAKEIQAVLKENNIQAAEELHPDLAHDFPPDFERSFDKAIDFIFKEQQ